MKLSKINTAFSIFRDSGIKAFSRALLPKLAEPDKSVNAPTIPETWTTFMSWLTFANAGMLTRGNAYCFDYAVKNLPGSAPIVEIGSFCGLSTNMITHCKERHGVRNSLITCDKWIFEGMESDGLLGGSSISHAEYHDFVRDTFIRNIKMFSRSDLPFTLEMFSDKFFAAWSKSDKCRDVLSREIQLGGPISFCYIDGDHSYTQARRDFDNCDEHLEPGGFILFDDSADGSGFDVRKVVKEVISTGRYEIVAKNPNYFFRKK